MFNGKKLRQLRLENNLTQKQLATLLGYGGSAVAQIELGYNNPTFDKIVMMADLFNISIDEFVKPQ